jgi:hypothetical protein
MTSLRTWLVSYRVQGRVKTTRIQAATKGDVTRYWPEDRLGPVKNVLSVDEVTD